MGKDRYAWRRSEKFPSFFAGSSGSVSSLSISESTMAGKGLKVQSSLENPRKMGPAGRALRCSDAPSDPLKLSFPYRDAKFAKPNPIRPIRPIGQISPIRLIRPIRPIRQISPIRPIRPIRPIQSQLDLRDVLQESFEHACSDRILEFGDRFGFDLPNAFASHFENPSDFFERVGESVGQTVA